MKIIITFLLVLSFLLINSYRNNNNLRYSNRKWISNKQQYNKLYGFDTHIEVYSNFESPCNLASDEGIALTDYMKLPVDQYVCIKMPLDATLERMKPDNVMKFLSNQNKDLIGYNDLTKNPTIPNNYFNLTVPPVRFFTLDVSPSLVCRVKQSDDEIIIESDSCTLYGSPYVESLNGCYKIQIKTIFTWLDSITYRAIKSKSTIVVDVDPPPPFKYFAKSLLEKTGTLAMSIALRQIENAFVQSLSKDYEKWALDSEYRIARQKQGTNDEYCVVPEDDDNISNDVPNEDIVESISINESKQDSSITLTELNVQTIAAQVVQSEETKVISQKEEDISVESTKSSPQFLTDDVCLLPGSEPLVRIETAPGNARRIYTGVDIIASLEDVWQVLIDYENLKSVVPSLVKNEVLSRTSDGGARLLQVGGAKVLPGVTFTAKTVLDVKIYTENEPIPNSMIANFIDESTVDTIPLRRGIFPQPYAITQLPHRDITMQNVEGAGDFEHYQGVWRMQSLSNCAPEGKDATRLTYAVEIRPKGLLPVKLIESRIASDLKINLSFLRDTVERKYEARFVKALRQQKESVRSIDVTSSSSSISSSISSSSSSISSISSSSSSSSSTIDEYEIKEKEEDRGIFSSLKQSIQDIFDSESKESLRLENINLKNRIKNLEKENNELKMKFQKIKSII